MTLELVLREATKLCLIRSSLCNLRVLCVSVVNDR